MLQKQIAGAWSDLYTFNRQPALRADFDMANFYMSRSAQSYFRQNRVASLQRPRGRVTLLNFALYLECDGQVTTHELRAVADYMSALAEYFGIDTDARYDDLA